MKISTINILVLDDEDQNVELTVYQLKLAGLKNTCRHISSEKFFLKTLSCSKPDNIAAGNSMPMFNWMAALRLSKEYNIPIPFILNTGSLTEDIPMECVGDRVDEFILKSGYKKHPSVIIRKIRLKNMTLVRRALEVEFGRNHRANSTYS